MIKFSICCLTILTAVCALPTYAAQVSDEFVVVHCESPGTLILSEEALIAPNLKVTGDIDRRDFETLKYATISVTRILDLSETNIHEYTSGDSGSGTRGDWMIGDPEKIIYPADMLPAGAFSELRDNSISQYTRGSETLSKVILPASLKGFMKGAFTSYSIITDLEVPRASKTLRQEGKLIYSYDGTSLLAMPPAWYGDVSVAASVTSVADGALDAVSPASVTFTSAIPPSLPEGASLSTAYIITPDPEAYSVVFPDIDCIKTLETVTLTDLQPGELMGAIGNLGYTRKDVRSVKISGIISADDFKALVDLPNLHAVDLSEALVECETFSTRFTMANSSITDFQFPKFSKSMSLVIEATSFIHGNLDVPPSTDVFYNFSKRLSSIIFPASLLELGDRSFPEYSVTQSLDFSRCSKLVNLKFSNNTQCLTDISLPENLENLRLYGPVKELSLPASVKEIYGSFWMVENLDLPKSLQTLVINSLPMVTEIDASQATSLYSLSGLNNVPNLKKLDISMCPITSIKNLFGASSYRGVVATGGTRYPATSVNNIESVKFPSTLTELTAFEDSPALKDIDLMQCFRLEKFIGGINCPSLVSIALPENLKSIQGLTDCPSLISVKSAAAVPPAYSMGGATDKEPLDFSKLSLSVAKGYAGSYRMAEGWENCKEISDNFLRVSISQYPLHSGVESNQTLLLYGAGLYSPGADATLHGYPSGAFALTGWSVNDELIESNPYSLPVNENIEAIADYSLDNNLCDAVIKVNVPKRQGVKLAIASCRRVIYVDGKKSAWWNRDYSNTDTYTITLNSGEHEIAIACSEFALAFADVEDADSEEVYSVTDFRVNNKGALTQFYPGYFDMDALDLSGQTKLDYISNRSGNRIVSVDISECPHLHYLALYNCGIEKLLFANTPLTDVRLSGNSLTEFDPTALTDITYLDLDHNKLRTLDITGLANLRRLDVEENGLTEFKYGGNDALTSLYISNNALPALDLNAFPALEYCSAYGQEFSMTIETVNFDTTLLGDGFEFSRASNWEAIYIDDEGYLEKEKCSVEGSVVVIPERAGKDLMLRYNYLISPEEDKSIDIQINLTRENFNGVEYTVADRYFTISGERIAFATGIRGELYTADGINIFSGYGESPVLTNGIYIVRVGSSVMKVSIQ